MDTKVNLLGHMALFCENIDNEKMSRDDLLLLVLNTFGLSLNAIGYDMGINPDQGYIALLDLEKGEILKNLSDILSQKLTKKNEMLVSDDKITITNVGESDKVC